MIKDYLTDFSVFAGSTALAIIVYSALGNGTPFHPKNESSMYANPQKLEFKVKDLNSDKKKETILYDRENKREYLMLRDEKGNLELKKYDLKIEYNEGESK